MAVSNDWMYAVECPRCRQPEGARCIAASGKRRQAVHQARIGAAIQERIRDEVETER